jgi:hypothetical protein
MRLSNFVKGIDGLARKIVEESEQEDASQTFNGDRDTHQQTND